MVTSLYILVLVKFTVILIKNLPTSENYYGYVNSFGPRACYDEGKRVEVCAIFKDYFKTKIKIIDPLMF